MSPLQGLGKRGQSTGGCAALHRRLCMMSPLARLEIKNENSTEILRIIEEAIGKKHLKRIRICCYLRLYFIVKM
jgi:hypothetical protein